MGDSRDLAIQMLADSEVKLIECVWVLSAERDSYRELAQAAIHGLHSLTRDRDSLRRQLAQLRDQSRHHQTSVIRAGEAA